MYWEKWVAFLAAVCLLANAAPSITDCSGNVSNGESITIQGLYLGLKEPAGPLVWEDFESREDGTELHTFGWDYMAGTGIPIVSSSLPYAGQKSGHCNIGEGDDARCYAFYDFAESKKAVYSSYYLRYDYTGFPEISPNFKFDRTVSGSYHDSPLRGSTMSNAGGNIEYYQNTGNGVGYAWPSDDGDYKVGGTDMNGSYHRLESYLKLSDPVNADNGRWYESRDLDEWMDSVELTWTDNASGSTLNRFLLPFYFAMSSGGVDVYYDDIYLDDTLARVEIGNSATWNECTIREIQVPIAWSNSSISFELNAGRLNSSAQQYIFIVDSQGNISEGYPAGLCQSGPAISSVSGTISHGESVTVHGGRFGSKQNATPVLWDTVDNIEAYEELADGDIIPSGTGYPWQGTNDQMHFDGQTANRRTNSGSEQYISLWPEEGRLHDLVVGGDMYLSWWFYPSHDWQVDDGDGGSNKIIRAGDDLGFLDGNQVSWTQGHFIIYHTGYPGNHHVVNSYFSDTSVFGSWNRMEAYFDNANGLGNLRINGQVVSSFNYSDLRNYVPADEAEVDSLQSLGLDATQTVGSPDFYFLLDDIYADSTGARVEMCNESLWNDSQVRHCEVQPTSSWSDGSITLDFNQGSFSDGETAYLYVIDSENHVSGGHQVTIGGGYHEADLDEDGEISDNEIRSYVQLWLHGGTAIDSLTAGISKWKGRT